MIAGNVTREVIKDLLPLYLDGEVSADTRLLVDRYLETDPELRNQAAAAAGVRGSRFTVRREVDDALAALEKTKARLQRQKWTQFFALFFTLAPFSFSFEGSHLKHVLLRDAPWSAIPLWGAAAVLWLHHWKLRRAG